jgi:hypothetical protein
MAKERTVRGGIDYGDLKKFAVSKTDHNNIYDMTAELARTGANSPEETEEMSAMLGDISALDNPEAFLKLQNPDTGKSEPALVDRPIKELNEMFGNSADGVRITQSDLDKMGSARFPGEAATSTLNPLNGSTPVIYQKGIPADHKPVTPEDRGSDPRRRPQV